MQTEIPIFKKITELYKFMYLFRVTIKRADRFSIWQKCENTILEIMDELLMATQLSKNQKLEKLENADRRLNILRMLLRIAKEIRTLNNNHYISLQIIVDEIGRMLGGWIKASRNDK
jgi:hypothetical protein